MTGLCDNAELSPAQLEALGDWNAGSVGGRAILDGWRGFMAGEPCPKPAWPYLRERGWHAAKAHCLTLASRAEASGRSLSHDSDSRRELRAIAGELATLLGATRFARIAGAARRAERLDKAARLGFVINAHVESARLEVRFAAYHIQEESGV